MDFCVIVNGYDFYVCVVECLLFVVVSVCDVCGIFISVILFDGFFCDIVVVFVLRFDIDFTWLVFMSKKLMFLESLYVIVLFVGFFVGFVLFVCGFVFFFSEILSRDSSFFVVVEVAFEACNEVLFECCVFFIVFGVDCVLLMLLLLFMLMCLLVLNECLFEGVFSVALFTALNEELFRIELCIIEVLVCVCLVVCDGVLLIGVI